MAAKLSWELALVGLLYRDGGPDGGPALDRGRLGRPTLGFGRSTVVAGLKVAAIDSPAGAWVVAHPSRTVLSNVVSRLTVRLALVSLLCCAMVKRQPNYGRGGLCLANVDERYMFGL